MLWVPLGDSPGFPNFTDRRGQVVLVTMPVDGIDHLFEVQFEDGTQTRGFEFEMKPVPRTRRKTSEPVAGDAVQAADG